MSELEGWLNIYLQEVKLINAYFLYWLSMFFYITMQVVETISLGARVSGKFSGSSSLGVTLHQSFSTLSRIFLPVFLIITAFLVERGMSSQELEKYALTGVGLSFLISLFLFIKIELVYKYFSIVISMLSKHSLPIALILALFAKFSSYTDADGFINYTGSKKRPLPKIVLLSFLSYFLLSSGILLSFLVAIHYPDYRLTAVQFSALFHGAGVVILAFYINPSFSLIMDSNSSTLLSYSDSVLIGKLLGLLFTFLVFLIIYIL